MSEQHKDSVAPEDQQPAAWAETPANLDMIPLEAEVQPTPLPDRLVEDAWAYLREHPGYLEHAKKHGHKIFAIDGKIIVSAELAAGLLAIGAVLIWPRHGKGKKK